ncbi:caveolin-2 [Menidia menidia]
MGLEREKLDTSIVMDEYEFNRSIEPIIKGELWTTAPDRDLNDVNAHMKVGFEDVIAEPISTHSFDRVWIGSHAAFELVKLFCYRLLTTLLAVPMAFILGLVFGVLSCLHIWLAMPTIQSLMMFLPSLQKVWNGLMDMFVTPLFQSMGKCLSSIQTQVTEN